MQKASLGIKNKKQNAFCLLIREEFLRRCKGNPSYSLRAFARQLGIDASLLSKVLRGHRNPSVEMIRSVGLKIGLKPKELSLLLKVTGDVAYTSMSDDIFNVISDWFHFALLELVKTADFKSDSSWIAKRLGIHKAEAEAAIERLVRLDFIEMPEGAIKLKASNNTWANNEMTSQARRTLQKQLALKASKAIDDVPFEQRESGSLTIACSKELIPQLKKKIQAFRKEIDEFIEAHEKPDEVYQLVVSFFPLTKIENESGDLK